MSEHSHRISGRQYDLLLVSLTPAGRQRIDKLASNTEDGIVRRVRKNLFDAMHGQCPGPEQCDVTNCTGEVHGRCAMVQKKIFGKCTYSVDNAQYWRHTGGNEQQHHCYNRYRHRDDSLEHSRPTVAITFGRMDLVSVFEVPGQYWSRHVRADLASSKYVQSVVGIPLHRYKVLHIRNKEGEYVRDFHRYRFRRPFVFISFVRLQTQARVFDFCRWLVDECEVNGRKLVHWDALPERLWAPGSGSDGIPRALSAEEVVHETTGDADARRRVEETHREFDTADPHRIECFVTLEDQQHAVIKAEFDNIDEVVAYAAALRQSPIGVLSTESQLSLNTESCVWKGVCGGGQDDHSIGRGLDFRVLVDHPAHVPDWKPESVFSTFHEDLAVGAGSTRATPQHYDYVYQIENIATMTRLVQVVEGLQNLASQGVDAVTIPEIKGLVSFTSKTWKPELAKGSPPKRAFFEPSFSYPMKLVDGFPSYVQQWQMELYDSRFNAEWLERYLQEVEYNCAALYSDLPLQFQATFQKLELAIRAAKRKLKQASLFALSEGIRHKKNATAKEQGEITDDEYEREESKHIADCLRLIREKTDYAHNRIVATGEILGLIEQVLHGRQDIAQVLSMSLPRVLPFQMAGAMNVHLEVGRLLITDYLLQWTSLAERLDDQGIIEWKGLVACALGKQLSTFSSADVVILPPTANYNFCADLPLFAHEAAHLLLRRVRESLDVPELSSDNRLEAVLYTARFIFSGSKLDPDDLRFHCDELRRVIEQVRPDFERPDKVVEEVFCDVFASATAGPSFGVACVQRLEDTAIQEKYRRRDTHLSSMARLGVVETVCKEFDMVTEPLFRKGELACRKYLWQLSSLEAMEQKLVDYVLPLWLEDAVLLGQVASMWNTDAADACRKLAEQMGWNDAVLVDDNVSPTQLASAAQYGSFLRRPFYPSGRVLLSFINAAPRESAASPVLP